MYMRFASTGVEPEEADRGAGFLTETTRGYLLGDWEASDSHQEDNKRNEIKARTRHALADFALLQEYADEELKEGVINKDADPPLFPHNAPTHFIQGLLRFASDAATGEEFTEYLFDAYDDSEFEELDEDSKTALQYAAGGNIRMYLRAHFQDWSAKADELGIEKREAVEALQRSWPD